MPDRCSTAFQDLHQHISDFGFYVFLFYWVKKTFRMVLQRQVLNSAFQKRTSLEAERALSKSFLTFMWSSGRKLLSAGENHLQRGSFEKMKLKLELCRQFCSHISAYQETWILCILFYKATMQSFELLLELETNSSRLILPRSTACAWSVWDEVPFFLLRKKKKR